MLGIQTLNQWHLKGFCIAEQPLSAVIRAPKRQYTGINRPIHENNICIIFHVSLEIYPIFRRVIIKMYSSGQRR